MCGGYGSASETKIQGHFRTPLIRKDQSALGQADLSEGSASFLCSKMALWSVASDSPIDTWMEDQSTVPVVMLVVREHVFSGVAGGQV